MLEIFILRPCTSWTYRVASVLVIGLSWGCSSGTRLAPAPNLYRATGVHPFEAVPEIWREADVEILYATDRSVEDDDQSVAYGYGRSQSVAIGKADIHIGTDLSWPDLVEASTTDRGSERILMELGHTEEIVRLPDSNTALDLTSDDEFVVSEDYLRELADARSKIHAALREQLSHTDSKEVYLYVHGYNNTFEYAAMRTATLWHFLGRQGVPFLYSWPAAYPDWFRGYNYDRESSEFTVFHLKQTVQAITSCPEVEKLNIIAHSRGTDVTLNMLREIWISRRDQWMEDRSRGEPNDTKLGTVVIAAADIDMNVFQQRFAAEWLVMPMDTIVFYLSQGDRAIGLSRWLFASLNRIGKLKFTDLSTEARDKMLMTDRVQVIDSQVDTDMLGHSYFIDNPAVLSDLILLLREKRGPGADNGRPLEREDGGFWTITDSYPDFSETESVPSSP
jgi:esterase/lipase superfamily enzyme